MVPVPAKAAVAKPAPAHRDLALFNTHTRESVALTYYDAGRYLPKSLDRINTILRDHRTDDVKPIDPRLLDALFALKSRIDIQAPIHIISGYRSPATNAKLRQRSKGVARTSYHVLGKAVDIRLPGYRTDLLRNQCLKLKSGGVGYYPASDFVHIDTGPVRRW